MHSFRLINALLGNPVDRTPIWIMRQAGRYLPEYRKLRLPFKQFCDFYKTPEIACEATLQPLKRFPLLDAAILFSDILTIPEAMGLDLKFYENQGPCIHDPIQNRNDLHRLIRPNVEDALQYVRQAVLLIKKELKDQKPLIGFSGSPWTLACYMIDGVSKNQFIQARKMAYQAPDLLCQILDQIEQVVIDYLDMQVKAGVDTLMIFDTWGGLLSSELYQKFSLNYFTRIITALKQTHPEIPIILFSKNIQMHDLSQMIKTGCNGISLDWMMNIKAAKKNVGNQVCLQGNLDPAIVCTDFDTVKQNAIKILEDYAHPTGHIFNLGHGITPQASVDLVGYLIETVASYKLK